MNRKFSDRVKTPNWSIIIRLIFVSILVIVIWKTADYYQTFLFDLPHYQPAVSSKLGILWQADPNSREVGILQVANGEIEYKSIATLAGVSNTFVDCKNIQNSLCAVERYDEGKFELFFWKVSEISNAAHSQEGKFPEFFKNGIVFAIVSSNVLMAEGGFGLKSIYSQNQDGEYLKLMENPEGGCDNLPKISPNEEFLALLCLGEDWQTERNNPLEPTGQHIHLIKVGGSSQLTLDTPPAFYFHAGTLFFPALSDAPFPAFEWSPDSAEIAFAASFFPPRPLSFFETIVPGRGVPYELYGGIYSLSIEDNNSLHEWIKVGGNYPLLTWSPDKRYIAYTLENSLYIVSREGKHRQVGKFDNPSAPVKFLSWSSDGAYIIVAGEDNIWILSTEDYTWREFVAQGRIIDVSWVSSEAK